ncbi:CCA tRNA nucleotidyltransferase [Peptostreptococcus faecalis]|uniref:CCA tRNA nucleotidyltransferase n=1 Tax=Peptostreptococcus faecalis TaxID=2045015 RepID=UPI000C7C89BE|nr:CCA tRNA nucleotidyltransferase [Peptostreptococcus faecalis]
MKLVIDSGAKEIIRKIELNGYEAFIVGGCVRDIIMSKTPNDWDITTSALPEDIINIFEKTIPTGLKHGTVTVLFGSSHYEVTTYRIDGEYVDMRHPEHVEYSKNIIDDLSRRDFTINAMAYNEEIGLIDKFNGVEDINKRLVRCVGNPDMRFDEDALRILRAIRFSAKLNFDIEENTYKSIASKANNLKKVSFERINSELEGIIKYSPDRLCILDNIGVSKWLFNGYIFRKDELELSKKIDYIPCEYQESYAQSAKKAMIFNRMDTESLTKMLKALRYSSKEILYTQKVHSLLINESFDNILNEKISYFDLKIEIKNIISSIGNIDLSKYAIYSKFIIKYKNPSVCFDVFNDIIDKGEAYLVSHLKINGRDLLENDIACGKKIGYVLEKLLEHIIYNPQDNKKEILLNLSKKIK